MPPTTNRQQTESQIRTWVANWTPGRLRALEYEARAGILSRVADLCDILVTDDRISAVLNVRVNGLLGLPVSFFVDADDTPDPDDPVARALGEDFWKMYPESALSELCRWALLVGVGVAQHVWVRNEKTGRLEPHLDVWHPSNVGYDTYRNAWFVQTTEGRTFIESGEGNWIIYTPFGSKRPWTWGLWRLLGRWWLLKQYAVTDWARHSESHGKPAYIIETTDAASNQLKNERRDIVADLQSIGELEAMALPFGFKVELLEASTTANDVFQSQIDVANDGIAIAILGQNLTTSVSGGSLAAARVHEQVRNDIKEFDEQTLSTALHNDSIRWWTELNFGAEQDVPWARWDITPPEDDSAKATTQKARAEALSKFTEFLEKAAVVGLPVDIRAIAEEFGIPLSELPAPEALTATLATRRTVEPSAGLRNGQAYIDSLVGRFAGFDSYQKSLDTVLAAVRDADSYEDLSGRLVELFEGLEPDEGDMLARSLRLAELAGRKSVVDDL